MHLCPQQHHVKSPTTLPPKSTRLQQEETRSDRSVDQSIMKCRSKIELATVLWTIQSRSRMALNQKALTFWDRQISRRKDTQLHPISTRENTIKTLKILILPGIQSGREMPCLRDQTTQGPSSRGESNQEGVKHQWTQLTQIMIDSTQGASTSNLHTHRIIATRDPVLSHPRG